MYVAMVEERDTGCKAVVVHNVRPSALVIDRADIFMKVDVIKHTGQYEKLESYELLQLLKKLLVD